MMTLVQVALGGALGASGRYLVTTFVHRQIGPGFPLGTMVVNVLGSVAMGVLIAILAKRGGTSPFLVTGLLGGFTTFSAFSLDAVVLWERGETVAALAYILGSVVASILGLALGLWIARGGLA